MSETKRWPWWAFVAVVAGLVLLLCVARTACAAGRYVWSETVVWEPGDRVLDLVTGGSHTAVGFFPDQVGFTTDTGSDFWCDIVTRSEAASDTTAGSGDVEVRYLGSGEMVPAQAVFLVRSAVSATDTVFVRCYRWVER